MFFGELWLIALQPRQFTPILDKIRTNVQNVQPILRGEKVLNIILYK